MEFESICQIIKDSGQQTFKAENGKEIKYRIIKVLDDSADDLIPISVPQNFGDLPNRKDIKIIIEVKIQNGKPKFILNKLCEN